MKKLHKLFIVLLVAVFVLSACTGDNNANNDAENNTGNTAGNTTENTTEDTAEDTTEEDTTEEIDMSVAVGVSLDDLNGVEIEFWHVWDRDPGDAINAIVAEFNENNAYGITVVPLDQGGYGDIFTNMNAAINTGELPDMVVGYNNQYLAWDSAGDIIVDLTPYIEDPVVGYSAEEMADFFAIFWEQDMINGERLGVPGQRSAQYMYYNVTWAQELGFDAPPTTPDEFYAQSCAAAEANGDGTGGWFLNTGASTMVGWIFGFDGQVEVPGEGYSFDTPETAAAFEFLYDLYADGCAWLPDSRYPNPEFATRQGLFFTSSIAGLPYQLGAFEEAGSTDEWTVIAFPSVTGTPVIDIYGPSFAMVASTPEEQLATWIFMSYFLEAENQATWIEASGYFPTRASVVPMLEDYAADHPQWADSYVLLEFGAFEPRFESWSSVRYSLQDASALIFQEDFDPATIGDILVDLQAEADELHAETLP